MRLRPLGTFLATVIVLTAGCTTGEQSPPVTTSTTAHATVTPAPSYSSHAATISAQTLTPESPSMQADGNSYQEKLERTEDLLASACAYVEKQMKTVDEGSPTLWPNKRMEEFSDEYKKLWPSSGIGFHEDLKKACQTYANIYSKYNG